MILLKGLSRLWFKSKSEPQRNNLHPDEVSYRLHGVKITRGKGIADLFC
jgi:hypothetical protein